MKKKGSSLERESGLESNVIATSLWLVVGREIRWVHVLVAGVWLGRLEGVY